MIKLTKNGIFSREWDPANKEYKTIKLDPDKLLNKLNEEIEIEDLTIVELFNLLSKDDLETYFFDRTFGCDLDDLKKQVNKKTNESADFDYIAVSEYRELFQPKKGKPWFTTTHSASGKKSGDDTNWALDLTPLSQMAILPIKVNNNAVLTIVDAKDNYSYASHKYEANMTVFNVLMALIDEFTFFGSDEEKEKTIKMLNFRVKEIENGTAKTIPFDEVMKKFDDEFED